MLRFQSPPDSIFLDMLHGAIEEALWWLELTEYDQEAFSNSYCQSGKMFPSETRPKDSHAIASSQ